MRNLILTLVLSVSLFAIPSFGQEKKTPAAKPIVVPDAQKILLRESQLAVQSSQVQALTLSNQIIQASGQLTALQKKTEELSTKLRLQIDLITKELREKSGCKDCVINEDLTFTAPEKTTPPAQ